jgi:hypothetical protein
LNNNEKIYTTIGIGYPAIKFSNKVIGKNLAVQCNDGEIIEA